MDVRTGVATSFWQELSQPLYVPGGAAAPKPATPGAAKGNGPGITGATIVVHGHRLPKPSEGEPIPAAHQGDYVSTPDRHIKELWRSPIDHGTVFAAPRDQQRYAQLNARLGELIGRIPTRTELGWLHVQQNRVSKAYPPLWTWLLVGVVALGIRRPRGWRAPVILTASGLLVVLITVLGVYAIPEYSVPVAPSLIMLGAGGLVGQRVAARSVGAHARDAAPAPSGP
jgi:hypothetical protein